MTDSAPPAAETDLARIRGDGYVAEAGWFGPDDRPRFGWLYRPDKPAANGVGIVIVPPFGFEAICAHRTLRHLAEQAARAGFPAVWLHLDGTGDSAGEDTDPERVEAWLASIQDACNFTRGAGASQLLLVGVRLGATLGWLAAVKREDIAAWVGINAVIRGRDFLRESRALQAAMGLRPSPWPKPDDGSVEVNGFAITAETCARLNAIDLSHAERVPATKVLLIERDDLPERRHWIEHLHNLGSDVEVRRSPGLVDMLALPHLTAIPQTALDICVDFARRIDACTLPGKTPAPSRLRSEISILAGDTMILEQTVLIDRVLFGVLSRPALGTSGSGVLLPNAGAANRIGPNRMYVAWARQWAAQGYWVFRVDLSGIGDSITRAGGLANHVYSPHGTNDVVRLAAWLHQQSKGNIVACGACSGAYHALRAALASDAIDTVVLINPGALQYIGSISNDETELNNGSYYNNQMKRGEGLRKILSGKVSPHKLVRVAGWFATTYGHRMTRWVLRKLHWPLLNDFGLELQALASRGVTVHFIFSADDISRARLLVQAGSMATRLVKQGHVHIQVIDGPDHTFTQRWAQESLSEALKAMLVASRTRPC